MTKRPKEQWRWINQTISTTSFVTSSPNSGKRWNPRKREQSEIIRSFGLSSPPLDPTVSGATETQREHLSSFCDGYVSGFRKGFTKGLKHGLRKPRESKQ